MEKIPITAPQLGQVLFEYARRITDSYLNEKEILESLRIEKVQAIKVFQEMMVIYMFIAIKALPEGVADHVRNEVEGCLHASYIKELIERSRVYKKNDVQNTVVLDRYNEYTNAMKSKEGPNLLWPLSRVMLKNLQSEGEDDPLVILNLATRIVTSMHVLPGMINEYRIVESEESVA